MGKKAVEIVKYITRRDGDSADMPSLVIKDEVKRGELHYEGFSFPCIRIATEPRRRRWRVIEPRSGFSVGQGYSRRFAMDNAVEILASHGIDGFKKAVERMTKKREEIEKERR
jgi:hypothetical protein